MDRECKFCHASYDVGSPEGFCHRTGQCRPEFHSLRGYEAAEAAMRKRDDEAVRLQMQREASPPMQINNFLALKILIGLFLFGAALAFVLSRWQNP
jgi:hypothetical protein